MTTAVYLHDDCLLHENPPGHAERVRRYGAMLAGLEGLAVDRHLAPVGADADILRCHPARYLDGLRAAVPNQGFVQLDPDTFLSPGTLTAALRGVGGVCAAVDAVLAGEVANAFVGTRPPGHHAEAETPMGFCLFGTVAIGAMRALEVHGLSRVAVVDFDVHHGNGTQALLWDEARALFVGSHQWPLYPGTGAASEVGAHGQVVNLPLEAGGGSAAMRAVYEAQVFPRLVDWRPDLILISAGFDAHRNDPLGGLGWETEDYAWITGRLCDVAAQVCGGRVVSVLEGGYDLAALTASVAAHVGTLQERGA
jgi:acetoin utilization deacetylase AcuC-like enzyme